MGVNDDRPGHLAAYIPSRVSEGGEATSVGERAAFEAGHAR